MKKPEFRHGFTMLRGLVFIVLAAYYFWSGSAVGGWSTLFGALVALFGLLRLVQGIIAWRRHHRRDGGHTPTEDPADLP